MHQRAGKNKEKKRGEGERGGWSGVAGGRERKEKIFFSLPLKSSTKVDLILIQNVPPELIVLDLDDLTEK